MLDTIIVHKRSNDTSLDFQKGMKGYFYASAVHVVRKLGS